VVRLQVLSRVDIGPPPSEVIAEEFFGPVALIDESKIVLKGPQFQPTERTRFTDQNNRSVDPADIEVGTLVSVTPGPPDAVSGSFEPTAVRVQVVDPRRPPPPRADIITGHIVEFEPIVLDGPRAVVNVETQFRDIEGGEAVPTEIASDTFVRVVTRPPRFGEPDPVAVQVTVLEGEAGAPPLPPSPGDEQPAPRPGEEIRIEGFVLEAGDDFLVLEGERLELDERVLVFDIGGGRITLDDLFPGDLMEIDTRPGGRLGFVVTRIKVIDPAVQTFGRPGVIVGTFEDVDEEELVLAGPFLKVPSDADIDGRGGRAIELGEIQEDDYVRLVASPPRFERGETLPVAFEIRVTEPPFGPPLPPGEEPLPLEPPFGPPGAERRVVASFPEDGDVEIPTRTAVEVTFDGNVSNLLFDPEFEFTLFPEPQGFGGLEISANGRTISAEVELESDQGYQLVVISKDTGLFSIRFTTGESISESSIFGEIQVPEELPQQARFLAGESFAVLIEELPDPELLDEFAEFEEKVVAGTPLAGSEFEFENVDPGSYFLIAFVGFDLGRGEFIAFDAFFDEDGDGEADPIEVGENEEVEVELTLALPEPLEIVGLSPEFEATGVDLETELVVEFNKPAFLVEEDILIFPLPEEIVDFDVSEDFAVYTLKVELAEDAIYRLVVENAADEEGGELIEPAVTIFTTADEFGELRTVSGRLVLPELPAARVFEGPILVGLVNVENVDLRGFGFESFEEEDVIASTIAFTPEFEIDNVPEGEYIAVAFTRVEVPRGFRPPDPEVRPLPDFDIRGGRFVEQVLEVFDTIELFGFPTRPDGSPEFVEAGAEDVEIFLRGKAKTRKEILRITGLEIEAVPLALADPEVGPPVVDAGEVEIAVRFNKPLRFDRGFVAVEAGLNGRFLREFQVDEDGRTIFFPVELEDGQFYKFSVFKAEAEDGSRLERPIDIGFSTGAEEVAFASIAGSVSLETLSEDEEVLTGDDADQIDEATIFLFEEEDEGELALVNVAEMDEDGTFVLDGVLPGAYQVFAEFLTASGQQINEIFDADGDGLADVLEVDEEDEITGVDITATVVVATEEDTTTGVKAKTAPPGGNAGAVLSIDLDPGEGDQSKSTLSGVEVDQEVTLDMHLSGATNVSGFAAKVRYDADILELVGATDRVSGRTNFLRKDNGIALFLSPLLRETELEYGGAVLGATEATAPDSAGFLARFRFKVKDEFEGTQIFLNQIKLKSTVGEDVLQPGLSAKLAPPVFVEQKKDVVSFDFNTAASDQEEFYKGFIEAGSLVEVDAYLNLDKIGSDFKNLSNYSVTIDFDPNQVTFVSYALETPEEGNLLASGGGIVPPLPAIVGENSATFGSAILGSKAETAPDESGFIGRLTFATTDEFSETDLLITTYSVKSVDGQQQEVSTLITARMSTGEIKLVTADGAVSDASADFTGDGTVDFGDFFAFADAFGREAEGEDAVFDLDGSGAIDFGDFFIFADLFAKVAGKLAAVDELPVSDGGLALEARSDEAGLTLALRSADLQVRGYGAVVEYDADAFRFTEASDAASALRADGEALLLTEEGTGEVLLLGSRAGRAGAADGLLAELRFEPLVPEALGLFRIREAAVRENSGWIRQVAQLDRIEARWVPQVFALYANYPNPFNPSTTIRYQVPHDAEVRLEIYDVLGQKVRRLVSEVQPAGYHRVVWDSRDDARQFAAAGVYFYRLQARTSAGEFTQVRKLLLLK